VPASPEHPDPERSPAGDAQSSAPALDTTGHSPINIRNLSVVCGRCHQYQTLAKFERRGDWNVYTYECETGACEPATTRTLIEVPAALDEFANRDPNWRGGKRHAGSG
jgi:hypothetical protein